MEFEEAVAIIIEIETGGEPTGAFKNDPQDPGGGTKWGISAKAYPNLDIPNLTREQAEQIYLNDYWAKLSCDHVPPMLRLIVFDCGVNQGCGFASEALAKVAYGPPAQMVREFAYERWRRYYSNPKFQVYGNGWTRRLLRISIETCQLTPQA